MSSIRFPRLGSATAGLAIAALSLLSAAPAGATDPWAGARDAIAANRESVVQTQAIIGADTRALVSNTTTGIYKRVVLIVGKFGTSSFQCSGAMINANTVATAGHCLHSRLSSASPWQYAKNVVVYPGANASGPPFGSCTAKSLHVPQRWLQNHSDDYDYGAIKLNCSIGSTVGSIQMSTSMTQNVSSLIVGYPGDKTFGSQWRSSGTILNFTPARVAYTNDTYGGMSGAPVLRNINGVNRIVAIHTTGSTYYNGGTRITQSVLNDFNTWKAIP